MGTQSSTLEMLMLDHVSVPANSVVAALGRTRAASMGLTTTTRGAAMSAGLLGTTLGRLGSLAAGYFSINTLKQGIAAFAEEQQAMQRIGYAANANARQTAAAHEAIMATAREAGVAHEGVEKAMSVLVTGTKRSLEEAAKLLPIVAGIANVTGAAPENVAKLADAMTRIMGLTPGELPRAFEMMNTAAREGRVQIVDLVAGLPRLAEVMGRVGYTGATGLQKTLAIVEMMSKRTADVGEAFAQTETLLKVTSTRQVAAFKKMGVDIIGTLTAAARAGKDPLEAIAQAIWKGIGGNLDNLNKRLQPEAALAWRNFLAGYSEVAPAFGKIGRASDELARRQAEAARSAEAGLNRLKDAWHEFLVGIGAMADETGIVKTLDFIGRKAAEIAAGIAQARKDYEALKTGKGELSEAGEKIAREGAAPELEAHAKVERMALESRMKSLQAEHDKTLALIPQNDLQIMGRRRELERIEREIETTRQALAAETPSEAYLREYKAKREAEAAARKQAGQMTPLERIDAAKAEKAAAEAEADAARAREMFPAGPPLPRERPGAPGAPPPAKAPRAKVATMPPEAFYGPLPLTPEEAAQAAAAYRLAAPVTPVERAALPPIEQQLNQKLGGWFDALTAYVKSLYTPAAPPIPPTAPLPAVPTVPVEAQPIPPLEVPPMPDIATPAAEAGAAGGVAAGTSFVDRLKAQLQSALSAIQPEIEAIKNALSFSASPTITPKVSPQAFTPGSKVLGDNLSSKARGAFSDTGPTI